jgi:hypothetical protein
VLAVALAAWVGEHTFVGPWDLSPARASRSLMSQAPAGLWAVPDSDEDEADSPRSWWDQPW